MATNPTHTEPGISRTAREAGGILTAALAMFTAAAFTSHILHSGTGHIQHDNWMGPAGGHLAGFLMDIFGYATWIIIFLMFLTSWKLFRPGRHKRAFFRNFTGWNLVVLSAATLAELLVPAHSIQPGGISGMLVSTFLSRWTGAAGTFLTCATALLAGLVIATPFSIEGTAGAIRNFLVRRKKRGPARDEEKPDTVKITREKFSVKKAGPEKRDNMEEGGDEPVIAEPLSRAERKKARRDEEKDDEKQQFEITPVKGSFKLPPLSFLTEPPAEQIETDRDVYLANAAALEQKLQDFGVAGKVVEISPGPVVTMYEFSPAPGIKINKVASLSDDLAMALKTHSVRIVAPIPGKAVIGIELANAKRQMVYLKEILESDMFRESKGALPMALGHDIVGHPVVTDLAKMPHLLIAGATGTGKSVGLNAMICSLLYRHGPDMMRILMIDPKRIELSLYDGIPHLIHPVVSEPKEATRALRWAVLEMERRYHLLEEAQARNLAGYNKNAEEPLPLLVIIIDELADLMMVSSKEVESAIARLAQMARAAGIHLMIATQRPSVDVLTGLIKANFPARLSFKVSSKVDSRTILDTMGAENLLGMGDMLFLPPGSSFLNRIHGAYVAEDEIVKIVEFLKAQGEPDYDPAVVEPVPGEESSGPEQGGDEPVDSRYDEAVEIVATTGQASISGLQRRLRVGYNRAARMIEQMERDGIVTPTDGMGRRQVIARSGREDEM